MATHSSILAWRIPWTEEPGGLQSMRSERVGHDGAALTHTHTHTNKLTLVVYKLIKNLLARLAQNNKIWSSVIIIDIQQVCWSK